MIALNCVNNTLHLFPYELVKPGEDVILYGFGKVGHEYYEQILANNYCNIKFIVDRAFKNYSEDPDFCKLVKNLESLKNEKCKIVIALARVTASLISDLKTYGVPEDRIVFCNSVLRQSLTKFSKVFSMDSSGVRNVYGNSALHNLKNIRKLLHPVFVDGAYTRIGKENDGGYVMLDDFASKDKIAYSFGISDDVSWDKDMVKRGFSVFQYDHTIDALPENNNSFFFNKKGVADSYEKKDDLEPLENFIKANGHVEKKNMILKMDVEGAEWGAIDITPMSVLNQFSQVVMELHDLLDVNKQKRVIKVLKKLTNGFIVAHIHANNFSDVVCIDGIPYPDALEVLLLNKACYKQQTTNNKQQVSFSALDNPCCKQYQEVFLRNLW